jgi:hypothetical protein
MSHPLFPLATQAKHDLGKYIAFQSRWLPESATNQDWHQALQSDLLQTRKGPKGVESAVEIWASLEAGFAPLADDEDIQSVQRAMDRIQGQLNDLQAGTMKAADLQALAQDAKQVATHLSALHKRLREA